MSSKEPATVPDLLLEQVLLDELPEGIAGHVRQRLAREPGGQERLAALEQGQHEILSAYPAPAMAQAIQQRFVRSSAIARDRRRSWIIIPAMAAATALLLLLLWPTMPSTTHLPGHDPRQGSGSELTERVKGNARLLLYRQIRSHPTLLAAGDTIKTGERLQLVYRAEGNAYGLIFSLDGRGEVTLHFPEDPTQSTALQRQGKYILPFSYELDDAPRFERFFFITSPRPIPVETVLDAARHLRTNPQRMLVLPTNLDYHEIFLRKAI